MKLEGHSLVTEDMGRRGIHILLSMGFIRVEQRNETQATTSR
jgi:hypothetical protein